MSLVVDAAIDALGEIGYARTSVTEIGARAGVSQGGMFRHFGTRLDVIVAAAETVCERQLSTFRLRLAVTDGTLRDLLELTRAASRDSVNAAWRELLAAARCDDELRARLAPTVSGYYARIVELARAQPALAQLPDDWLGAVVMTVLHALDGEALTRSLYLEPEPDAQRPDVLEVLLTALTAAAPPPG